MRRIFAGESPSQMRNIFRRWEEFFAVANNSYLRRIATSDRRRKCELFFANEKNFSQLRIFYFRKWSRNTAGIGLSLLVFELNHFKDLSKILSYFRKIIRICAGDPTSQCDANTNYSQLRKIFLICEKYFGKTANFGRICEIFSILCLCSILLHFNPYQ